MIPQNTFSGNRGYGLAITGRAHDNRVFDSFIGTAILGLTALGNGRGGVLVPGTAYRNSIGPVGTKPPSNLISGNAGQRRDAARRYQPQPGGQQLHRARPDRAARLPNAGRPVMNLGRRNVVRANRT